MFKRKQSSGFARKIIVITGMFLLMNILAACGNKSDQAVNPTLLDTQGSITPTSVPTDAPTTAPPATPPITPTVTPDQDNDASNSDDDITTGSVRNNGGLFVEYQGVTYYRQYNADSYEPTGLWGSYNPTVGSVKNMMKLSEDGRTEVAFEDTGEGNIYIAGNRLYLQEPSADYGTKIYSVALDGSDRQEIGDGFIAGIDEGSQTIVCLLNGADYFTPVLATVNAITGEVTRFELSAPCATVLAVEDGVIFYRGNVDYEISQLGAALLCSIKVDGSGERLLARTSDSLYDYSNWGTEIPCFQKIGNTIYFAYGAYAGTGNFYQGGQIASVNTDGSNFEILAGSITDYANAYEYLVDDIFYVSEENGSRILYYTSGEQQTATALDLNSNQLAETDSPLFIHDVPFEYNGGIIIYQNASASWTTLVPAIDYSTLGIDQESEDHYFTIKDVEVCGDRVYYKIEANLYYPAAAIGWRDGYKRLKTQVLRATLDGTVSEILYEY